MNQTEKLESQPVTRHFMEDVALDPIVETISTPPNGFRMPSIHAVRMHDARLSARMGARDTGGDLLTVRDEDGNEERHETACFLPSFRSRSYVSAEFKGMGITWGE
jgi:hypothetical protein